jgi:hypothetical protein
VGDRDDVGTVLRSVAEPTDPAPRARACGGRSHDRAHAGRNGTSRGPRSAGSLPWGAVRGPPPRLRVTFDPGAAVEGFVFRDAGVPVLIAIVKSQGQWTDTDDDGSFRLEGLTEGDVQIEVTSSHTLPLETTLRAVRGGSAPHEIHVESAALLVVQIPQDAVVLKLLEIRVRADDGTELARANLEPFRLPPAAPGESIRVAVKLPSLKPGRCTVEATWDGRRLPTKEIHLRGYTTAEVRLEPR